MPIDGNDCANVSAVRASILHISAGHWATLLQALTAHFPHISEASWRARIARGRVQNEHGEALDEHTQVGEGLRIRYFREVEHEVRVPFAARIVHVDDDILIADKPHFLPVMPAGRHVEETLQTRLIHETGNPDLVPLHRIDRATAGLVMFSTRTASRRPYQELFRQRLIEKTYEARAPGLPGLQFPLTADIRLETGEPFFRMRQVDGVANARTVIEPIERGDAYWTYRLQPITGRKHQLRVQMAMLGAAILNDEIYPELQMRDAADFSRPLALVARALRFRDPQRGLLREFVSDCLLPAPT